MQSTEVYLYFAISHFPLILEAARAGRGPRGRREKKLISGGLARTAVLDGLNENNPCNALDTFFGRLARGRYCRNCAGNRIIALHERSHSGPSIMRARIMPRKARSFLAKTAQIRSAVERYRGE